MAIKIMTKKDLLGRISIDVTHKGFTIWVTEPGVKGVRHWLVDASLLYEDGELRLGNKVESYNFQAIYSGGRFDKKIVFIDKRKKVPIKQKK